MARRIDDATLAEIEAELAGDGVWIDAGFAREHQVSAADEARLEQLVADADHADLRMLLVEVDRDDDRFHGSFSNLAAWVHDSMGGDATYVGWQRYGDPQLTMLTYGDQPDAAYVTRMAEREHPDDLVEAVVHADELLEQGTAQQLWEALPRDERYPWLAEEPLLVRWFGDLTAVHWVVLGLLAAVLLLGAGAWWRARRARRRTDFVLPTAVLRSVRRAEDRQVRDRAEREVLALGEALGAGDPDPGALGLWQEALDHHDVARAVLERAGTPADVVGALVLARKGESARAAAVSGTATGDWRPPVPCYFNPLHPASVRTVTWGDEQRSAQVPACRACAAAVEEGREPDDVLDFIADGSTVHYFRLDIGVWSRTGYGALEPDLIGALRAGRGRRGGPA